LPEVDAVVSSIPADAQTDLAEPLAASAQAVFDVVYHPQQTPCLVAAAAYGRIVIPGFELLLHQAGRQVELMTGTKTAPLQQMRDAGLRAL
jgi:shikimate dehydrogenase